MTFQLFTQKGVNRKALDLGNLSPGIYLLRITGDDEVVTKKVAIQ